MKKIISIFALIIFLSCQENSKKGEDEKVASKQEISKSQEIEIQKPKTRLDSIKEIFKNNPQHKTSGFDFPVGKPDAKNYYNAQKFTENYHLGEDWNHVNGGNSDLGHPIYSAANGYVYFARDNGGGWGNVIRVFHQKQNGEVLESLYAHCDTILVKEKQFVKKGQKIGTIGTANGAYLAHLHFEIRTDIEKYIGDGYDVDTTGFVNPTRFINENRSE
ncbi:M23 family metallopeptidase [Aureivirga sp. CE67]|uniref:M23 family metallopeptidase n=1 Tax=Aureivirga sp. CE67 TaxID=1788983 RepID=UPI0018CB1CAD|nr:M23 family metallopeptidase [Aureivirga sp. CE67]